MLYQNFLKLSMAAVITLMVFFLGCAGGSSTPTTPPVSPDVIIPDTTKIFNESENGNLLDISDDGEYFTFSSESSTARSLAAGDVIVGVKDEGYLRKVVSTNTDSMGNVIVETEGATLEDAVQKLSFSISRQLTPDDIRDVSFLPGNSPEDRNNSSVQGFYLELNDVVLYDDDGNLSTKGDQVLASGGIGFDPRLVLEVDLNWFTLQELTFYNEIVLQSELEVKVEAEFDVFNKKKELARYNFNPITIIVGGFPVIITPVLRIMVGVDVTVDAGVKTSLECEFSYKAGMSYSYGEWAPINELTSDCTFNPPNFSFGGNVKAYYGPELSFLLYGLAGPYVNANANLEFDVDLFREPVWELYGGLEVGAGCRVEFLGRELANKEFPAVIGYRHLIASGGSLNSAPVASAYADPNPQSSGLPVQFHADASSDPDGDEIIFYEWDWNNDGIFDESGESLVYVEHTFNTAGTYQVQLRVTDEKNLTDMLDNPLEIRMVSGVTGNISGVIRDGANNESLSGAEASTNAGGYQSDTTGFDGLYNLNLLPIGMAQVDFACSGYVSTSGFFEIIENETIQGDWVLLAPNSDLPGSISGTCINAQTGLGIGNVSLVIREGINNLTGTVIDSTSCNDYGDYTFSNLDAGNYTISGEIYGYCSASVNGVCLGGNTTQSDLSFSPSVTTEGELRIVLTWAEDPRDLDSHLLTPEIGGNFYHIYFPLSHRGSLESLPYANLDVDDVSSYGPETITISQSYAGIYKYYVYDYAGYGSISTTSNAVVKVFDNTGLIAEFHAPGTGEDDRYWEVFDYNGSNGSITTINQIRNYQPVR